MIINQEVGNVTSRDTIGFSDGIVYYWRIKAGNPNGWSGWSPVRTVATAAY